MRRAGGVPAVDHGGTGCSWSLLGAGDSRRGPRVRPPQPPRGLLRPARGTAGAEASGGGAAPALRPQTASRPARPARHGRSGRRSLRALRPAGSRAHLAEECVDTCSALKGGAGRGRQHRRCAGRPGCVALRTRDEADPLRRGAARAAGDAATAGAANRLAPELRPVRSKFDAKARRVARRSTTSGTNDDGVYRATSVWLGDRSTGGARLRATARCRRGRLAAPPVGTVPASWPPRATAAKPPLPVAAALPRPPAGVRAGERAFDVGARRWRPASEATEVARLDAVVGSR